MNDYRRQQIHAKALELLESAGVTDLSVDPIRIAEHLEIDVHAKPAHVEGASGWLIKSGEHFGIAYATHIPNERFQRFSIAHELGHYWLDSHPAHIFKNGSMHQSHAGFGSADPIELEADYFASCLLMPATLCKRVMWGSKDGMAAVKALADKANTSLQASAIRYAEAACWATTSHQWSRSTTCMYSVPRRWSLRVGRSIPKSKKRSSRHDIRPKPNQSAPSSPARGKSSPSSEVVSRKRAR